MKPFVPSPIRKIQLDFATLLPSITKAHQCLARYSGLLQNLVEPKILTAPMFAKEATMSSMIEGTQATVVELYEQDAGAKFNSSKEQDIQEINNYCEALDFAVRKLEDRPFIYLNMIREIHSVLLAGVRGENKDRGEFRSIQNWIGVAGSTMATASYIPPEPQYIIDYLDDWEKFLNDEYADLLVQLALIHAQFEIIHPFLDGNGRLGRILIPLFLFQKEYLNAPVFYLSEYFEKNRQEYYNRLSAITREGDWHGWVVFFLRAIAEQSDENNSKICKMQDLYNRMKVIISETTKSSHSQQILDMIFTKPIFNSRQFTEGSGIKNRGTANSLLQKLVSKQVLSLRSPSAGSRASIYAFSELVELISD